MTFRDLVAQLNSTLHETYEHQEFPFEMLVRGLKVERSANRNPIFQTAFQCHTAFIRPPTAPGLVFEHLRLDRRGTPLDLNFAMIGRDGNWRISVEYSTEVFDEATIVRMLEHYQNILSGIALNPDEKLSRLPILSPKERSQILFEWNNTLLDCPENHTIHQLFERQVALTPNAIALVHGANQLTYAELNRLSNCRARQLQNLGVQTDTYVAVYLDRTIEMVIGLMAILKAGAAYVPLDPSYPRERMAFCLKDCGASIILTQRKFLASLPPHEAVTICLDDESPAGDMGNPDSLASGSSLAYMIYTSGSTGTPKGVAIEHHGAVNLINWARKIFSDVEMAGVLASTSICFDLSVFELFVTLSRGGKVILATNLLELPLLPARSEVTLINTVPSAVGALLQSGGLPPQVKVVNLAGEPLPASIVDKLYALNTVDKVYDLYGPTETTTYSTFTLRRPGVKPSIGRPIANTRIYILDDSLQPVPIGVAGEFFIGWSGLARGYHNRPQLTVEKFITDPFDSDSSVRIYRTGDRARYLADGNLEYLGRFDHQIKLRGFRIELGEIESVVAAHPAVIGAVVEMRADATGDKSLVAYLVLRQDSAPKTVEIQEYLRSKLPEHMVPARYVLLDKLPLTPNGKVDRKALIDPGQSPLGSGMPLSEPRNLVEAKLLSIFRRMLHFSQGGIDESFFNLGGNSLLAVRVVNEINKELGVNLNIPTFFKNPSVRSIAGILRSNEHKFREPRLIPLKAGNPGSSIIFLDAGVGLCRLADALDGAPSSYATSVPVPEEVCQAAIVNDQTKLLGLRDFSKPHTELIQRHVPPGPVVLVGYSFGGFLAFEVAHQLMREGREVKMILLMDTWAASTSFTSKLKILNFKLARESITFRLGRLQRQFLALVGRRPVEIKSAAEDAKPAVGDVPWPVLEKVFRFARRNYQLHPLATRGVVFRARESSTARLHEYYATLGWGDYFHGGMDVVDCPGDHFTLLKGANLQFLATYIQDKLAP
jgi:amino acid adenylation domain-containing protein